MEASKNALDRIVTCVDQLKHLLESAQGEELSQSEKAMLPEIEGLVKKYEESMEDDFNTADAIAAVFELVKFTNTQVDGSSTKVFAELLLIVSQACVMCLG